MNQRGLVHPAILLAIPAGVYPSLCTVQAGSGAQDAYGHEQTVWGDLAGVVGVPCRIAPVASGERRQPNQVYAEATHTVSLAGYYPAILPTMRAMVDGVAYDVQGVEFDGNRVTTRLPVRRVA